MLIEWIGFFVAIAILLIGSRYHLGLALLTGAIVLGLFTISPFKTAYNFYLTATDLSTMILIGALTLIPVIGGVLQESGLLDNLINNLRIGKKLFLGFTPALLGLLPIPGGALFSAPMVDEAGEDLGGHEKTAINVWFRHILFFVFPIAPALMIPADIANISVYSVLPFTAPFLLLTLFLGYFFFLRKVEGEMTYEGEFSLKELMIPLSIILTAPILDFVLKEIFKAYNFSPSSIATLIAISTSLLLLLFTIDWEIEIIKDAMFEMEPWNFFILLFGIFVFINVFNSSGIDSLIESLNLSGMTLAIGIGFLLGLATGRINVPASVVIPIYLASLGLQVLSPLVFALIFTSVFMGYVITPVHPCVGISLEFFDGDIKEFLKIMGPPVAISLAAVVLTYIAFV
ncbi:MAG: DUF401 family protein [Candidatus Thermoplasmatota archaeon]|nr:DUF401 family protein [Candidatus Thermoplasmatota archaeon]